MEELAAARILHLATHGQRLKQDESVIDYPIILADRTGVGVLQAGAGVVLAPLWDVDDQAMMLLMVKFYEKLTRSERPRVATAWRRACRWLRTETPYTHPSFWAGFLPSGDARLRLTA